MELLIYSEHFCIWDNYMAHTAKNIEEECRVEISKEASQIPVIINFQDDSYDKDPPGVPIPGSTDVSYLWEYGCP